jgi:hypothetical protein
MQIKIYYVLSIVFSTLKKKKIIEKRKYFFISFEYK